MLEGQQLPGIETGTAESAAGWRGRMSRAVPSSARVGNIRHGLRGIPIIPAILLVLFVSIGLIGPYVTPHDPLQQNLQQRLRPPAWEDGGSSTHLLGTDSLGRDVLSRLIA